MFFAREHIEKMRDKFHCIFCSLCPQCIILTTVLFYFWRFNNHNAYCNCPFFCSPVVIPTASGSTTGQSFRVRWRSSAMTVSHSMKVSSAAAFTRAMWWRATGPSMNIPVIVAVSISCLLASIASSATGAPCVPPSAPSAESQNFRIHILQMIVPYLALTCQ